MTRNCRIVVVLKDFDKVQSSNHEQRIGSFMLRSSFGIVHCEKTTTIMNRTDRYFAVVHKLGEAKIIRESLLATDQISTRRSEVGEVGSLIYSSLPSGATDT